MLVNDPSAQPIPSASFDVDGMLGRLAKWLRILGFDAVFPRSRPSAGRLFVTARRSVTHAGAIVVSGEDPSDQLRQVLDHAGIRPDPRFFLSRCLICNVPVREVQRQDVAGKVPDGVFQRSLNFHECPECGRIYWEGSHAERIKKRLEEST
ncbi:MAG: Mut7-C RNAse domain-containing protein [Desulfomonilaceae bacterium]